jgi:hypothetical protein
MFGLLPRGTAYILLLAVVLYAGVQFVPVYYSAWQFYDAIRQEVRFAGTGRRTVGFVHESIMQLAQEYAAPVLEEDVEVSVEVTRDGPFFIVAVYYAVPIDMRLFQHEVEFDWRLSGETFAE